jgi:CRISPR-associated protein Cas6
VVDGHRIDIGPPSVLALKSEPELYAHRVAIRGGEDPARFDAGIRRQLDELEIRAEPIRGERRLLRLGDHAIVTHGLTVTALSDEDSLHLQEAGLGGRRKMGCGVFVRPNEEASLHRGGSWRRRENGGDV